MIWSHALLLGCAVFFVILALGAVVEAWFRCRRSYLPPPFMKDCKRRGPEALP